MQRRIRKVDRTPCDTIQRLRTVKYYQKEPHLRHSNSPKYDVGIIYNKTHLLKKTHFIQNTIQIPDEI